MRGSSRSNGNSLARAALLAAGVFALAGCATGYSLVQPDAGGAGSYYTGAIAYPTAGYYEDGLGAFDSYAMAFGYGNLYGPSFTFGLGLGSTCGWNCEGYYGGWPWYYGSIGYYGRRHHGHHHHGDPIASAPSPRPWLDPDHPRVPPSRIARGATPPIAAPERPVERLANRRVLESASFAPRGIDRAPQRAGIPDRTRDMAPQPSVFADRPSSSVAPRDFARPAAPAAAPSRVAPPPARSSHSGSDKIR
ncbi:MAG: hypothetical protein V4567_06945 [Pseudomonadota bacterium]